jgi:hypothetical protein
MNDWGPTSNFNLTHEAMAQILGVSRSGVSLAAGLLQMKGLDPLCARPDHPSQS